ncbi:D-glucuronyl C5-epimerase family protein [Acinetobacter haemolyticus]|uniref:D-glucuronyl C5-epimerase family protein n=1 Tax=Acinetobacter haemolyticus TaxID=29430 RepID=UPI0013A53828|nr:D-glucuronyl C5-epimerase family protein [Acinetobacter haemolyticus]
MACFKKSIIFIVWFALVSFIFNKYAYEIFEFNTSLRVFIKEGKTSHREFDEKGLPISYSARIGEYQSPFYVVHYAIIYSEHIGYENKGNKLIWREDPSLEYWNVYPDLNDQEKNKIYFKNSVDWLVDNVDYSLNGKAHYLYNFDWPYKGFNNNKLESGWWSGLTDAYAIIPLLRAYEIYGEEKYYKVARDLYNSSLTKYEEFGSLTYLNGQPWIEEYMDRNITDQNNLPYVFNGMVYSTFGIQAYESLDKESKNISNKLLESIAKNVSQFNNNGWSYYDLYQNSNNIKYHLVHASLLDYLIKNDLNKVIKDKNLTLSEYTSKEWNVKSKNLGFNYLVYGNKVFAYYHFLFLYILFLLIGLVLVFFRRTKF